VKAISSMATRLLLADLMAAADDAGLGHVEIESVGGVDAADRVAAGEEFDLVFLADGALAKLAADGHVVAASVAPLVLSQVAVGAPSGTDAPATAVSDPAFPDAAAVREAIREARKIGYSTGPSGTALVSMIEDWGLSAEVGDRLVQARPGIPVARLLADGDVDLGFQQLSELVGSPGVSVLGVLPQDCAIDTVFSGAIAATSSEPEGAAAILAFLRTDAARDIARSRHFAPPPAP